ncbi:hypothetical protein VCR4J2_240103 [Vibrio coralliirubri]|nr:hypothetical protein VCR4J2_240103 [Vibrio coralliirubri]
MFGLLRSRQNPILNKPSIPNFRYTRSVSVPLKKKVSNWLAGKVMRGVAKSRDF